MHKSSRTQLPTKLAILLVLGCMCSVVLHADAAANNTIITDVHHTPLRPKLTDTVTITANITDPDGIAAVYLKYCNASLCFLPKRMNRLFNSTYAANLTLTIFSVGDVIKYNITVHDKLGNIASSPDYQFTIYPPAELLPDLAVSENDIKFSSGLPAAGEEITIYAIVHNIGSENASAVRVDIAIDTRSNIIYTTTVEITAGKYASVSCNWLAVEGMHSVIVVIDPSDEIVELSENNNEAVKQIVVQTAQKAPEFTLTDIDGDIFNLSDFRGKVVVLDIMATWCPSCKKVEKNLKQIYPKYRKEIEIITIDIDPVETDAHLRAYRDANNIPWLVARDTDRIVEKYSVFEIAKIVIINKEGYITYTGVGEISAATLTAEIEKALQGSANTIPLGPPLLGLVGLAMFAGVSSFFSPCSFPLLPGYIAYYLGITADTKKQHRKKLAWQNFSRALAAGGFSAGGIIAVFLIVGLVALSFGSIITPYIPLLQLIVGVIIVVLGLLMLTNIQYGSLIKPFRNAVHKLRLLARKKAPPEVSDKAKSRKPYRALYGKLFAYGVGYGAASAGCTAPLFIMVIFSAFIAGGFVNGFLILLVYTLVAAGLMIVITLLVAGFRYALLSKLKVATKYLKVVSGLVLIAAGCYLVYYYLTAFT